MGLQVSRTRIGVVTTTSQGMKVFDAIERPNRCEKSFISTKEDIRKQLIDIANNENVCGFVVGWPLEPSGYPGSRCGRVLNLLDYFADTRHHDGGYLLNKHSRPVTLMDERMFTHGQFDEGRYPTDEWGRCEVFGKKFPLPSEDKFGKDKQYMFKTSLTSDHPTSEDSTSASLILEHFMLNFVDKDCSHDTTKIPHKRFLDSREHASRESVDDLEIQQIME